MISSATMTSDGMGIGAGGYGSTTFYADGFSLESGGAWPRAPRWPPSRQRLRPRSSGLRRRRGQARPARTPGRIHRVRTGPIRHLRRNHHEQSTGLGQLGSGPGSQQRLFAFRSGFPNRRCQRQPAEPGVRRRSPVLHQRTADGGRRPVPVQRTDRLEEETDESTSHFARGPGSCPCELCCGGRHCVVARIFGTRRSS